MCATIVATGDYRARQVSLSNANFQAALQAVHNIPGAPSGAYWDGGVTDYPLHLNYAGAENATKKEATHAYSTGAKDQFDSEKLVLYPHFQRSILPDWLDKRLTWRHGAKPFLDTTVVLAPNPEWVKTLPNSKLPDRTDFTHCGNDLAGSVKAWTAATRASQQLVDEFIAWLDKPDMNLVCPL